MFMGQKTKSFIKIRNKTIAAMIIGVMYLRNHMAIFILLALFRKSLLLSRSVCDCAEILFRLLSRFRSISNDSVMILLTSTSSWFSLSKFSCAFASLNSFFFLSMTRSVAKLKLATLCFSLCFE